MSASTERIVREFHLKSETNKLDLDEEKKLRTIVDAGKLIIQDLRKISKNSEIYDIFDKLENPKETLGFVPISLQIFLKTIITAKNNQSKIPSVAQSIIQFACPKTIVAPLQVFISFLKKFIDLNFQRITDWTCSTAAFTAWFKSFD